MIWLSRCVTCTLSPRLATLKKACPLTLPRSSDAGAAAEDDLRRRLGLGRDVQGARQVVGGAERQDAERQAGLAQGRRGRVHRAVAAAEDHAADFLAQLADQVAELLRPAAGLAAKLHAARLERGDEGLDLLRRAGSPRWRPAGPAGRSRAEDQRGAAGRLCRNQQPGLEALGLRDRCPGPVEAHRAQGERGHELRAALGSGRGVAEPRGERRRGEDVDRRQPGGQAAACRGVRAPMPARTDAGTGRRAPPGPRRRWSCRRWRRRRWRAGATRRARPARG